MHACWLVVGDLDMLLDMVVGDVDMVVDMMYTCWLCVRAGFK